MNSNLNKFITAQEDSYIDALFEIKNGKKENHWMWYIFPQIKGLGSSPKAMYYSIKDLSEAKDYLNHAVLGKRLVEITNVLLRLKEDDPQKIFGFPDDLKLKSSMTLFSIADGTKNNIFNSVIHKFFNREYDDKTLEILNSSNN
jgi:uncharacterized protein (DUF1810 family)